MLEHQIVVLNNVCNDENLFRKELVKSKRWLTANELEELKRWLLEMHYKSHKETINEVLSEVTY